MLNIVTLNQWIKTNFMSLKKGFKMEENKTQEVVEEKTETTEPKEEAKAEEPKKEEKTFTQDEVNEIVKTRLAKEKKGIHSKEELQEFTNWKESQKTEAEKQAEKEKENQEVVAERDNLRRENLLLKKGVNDDDLDYVLFKVSKLEGNFEENLTQYLADNPKYLKSYEEPKKTVDLGGEHSEESPNDDDEFVKKIMGIK